MGFRKVKDIAVVTGTYTDASGTPKNRYANVGCVMKNDDDGHSFLLLNRHFNPAGVPFKDGKDQVVLSLFEIREENGQSARPAAAPVRATADDDVPF